MHFPWSPSTRVLRNLKIRNEGSHRGSFSLSLFLCLSFPISLSLSPSLFFSLGLAGFTVNAGKLETHQPHSSTFERVQIPRFQRCRFPCLLKTPKVGNLHQSPDRFGCKEIGHQIWRSSERDGLASRPGEGLRESC